MRLYMLSQFIFYFAGAASTSAVHLVYGRNDSPLDPTHSFLKVFTIALRHGTVPIQGVDNFITIVAADFA